MKTEANPLLETGTLPRFRDLITQDIEPVIRDLIERTSKAFEALEQELDPPIWKSTLGRLYEIQEPLNYAWRAVSHLAATKNTPELRAAHEALEPEVVELLTRIAQSKPIYESLNSLKKSQWSSLDNAQRRLVEHRLQEAELAGVGLEGEKLGRFKEIQKQIASLGTQFENNVVDSDNKFGLILTKPQEVDGIPDPVLGLMAANAATDLDVDSDPKKGPWKVSLQPAVLAGVLRNATDRSLRETVLRAYLRAASQGDLDNRKTIVSILQLRQEAAGLLGYKTFAEMNFMRKMADSPRVVDEFLDELRKASRERADRHAARLTDLARQGTGDDSFELEQWDQLFWSEKLREEEYGFSSEALRRYFPFEQVLEGLFDFCTRLFGITFQVEPDEDSLWDPHVVLYQVLDESGELIAHLYIDPFSRPGEKRPGAWSYIFHGRHRREDGSLQVPATYIICNQLPPVGETPSLMNFQEVSTLFHEMGHALHHMLTEVEIDWASGNVIVEWDAVELPSTFMEYWLFEKETLLKFARDYETGEELPEELFDKLTRARTLGSGLTMTQKLWITSLDLELHALGSISSEGIREVVDRVTDRDRVIPPPDDDQFLCRFGHIFNGGYAAGYYSYLWSDMLSTDVFAAFQEAGPEGFGEVGKRLKDKLLAPGGSRHPSELFQDFRGRGPSTKPLIEHLDLG